MSPLKVDYEDEADGTRSLPVTNYQRKYRTVAQESTSARGSCTTVASCVCAFNFTFLSVSGLITGYKGGGGKMLDNAFDTERHRRGMYGLSRAIAR
jgi:hypothetical protein